MEVEIYSNDLTNGTCSSEGENKENIHIDEIVEYLINNDSIYFKNQQRNEKDLTYEEKRSIAKELFVKSKASFLTRFGTFLKHEHLEFFQQYAEGTPESYEVGMLLNNLTRGHSKAGADVKTKNRRYEALKRLIEENSYFSETEMMKRNPLLYEQLVGQYMSQEEKRERDRLDENNTLVKIIMEGIERDEADIKKKLQEEEEDNAMEEEDSDEDEESEDNSFKFATASPKPSTSRWGEFDDLQDPIIRKNAKCYKKEVFITAQERQLLRNEFTTLMYQNFLDGKDDFDYTTVDNSDKYDNIDILGHDEEDKYFDSEEPEDAEMDGNANANDSSEDELDIYMSALNQHPTVCKLSKDLEKL